MCGASSQGGRSDQAPATGLREVVRPCPWVDVCSVLEGQGSWRPDGRGDRSPNER